MAREFVEVDPGMLRLPSSRMDGADPTKLARQIARHGGNLAGMPPPWVVRGKDGEYQIVDGVTRATRAAKLAPGQKITVEVIEEKPNRDLSRFPRVMERIP